MPESFLFRRAHAADLAVLSRIEQAAGFSRWSQAQLAESLANHQVYVIEQFSCVVGFVIFGTVMDESELLNMTVAPDAQGQGAGKALLGFGLAELRQQSIYCCFLEVGVNNHRALALYSLYGFSEIARRKNYYHHGSYTEDAIIMKLNLGETVCSN